jgi:cysteine desulfurase
MLSATARYALRALSHLAADPDRGLRGRELASETGVPANYLSKLLLTLGNAGIIEASRGIGGGYRLARKPEQIPVAEVVELFDKEITNPPCLLGLREVCSDEDPCCAHASWRTAKLAYLEFLHGTTLADISPVQAGRRGRVSRAGRR